MDGGNCHPNEPNTFNLEFWDDEHGIEVGQEVKVELTVKPKLPAPG